LQAVEVSEEDDELKGVLPHCGKIAENDVLTIAMVDLLYALGETRPSVSTVEQVKYQRM
jgi:hypothetical protein